MKIEDIDLEFINKVTGATMRRLVSPSDVTKIDLFRDHPLPRYYYVVPFAAIVYADSGQPDWRTKTFSTRRRANEFADLVASLGGQVGEIEREEAD